MRNTKLLLQREYWLVVRQPLTVLLGLLFFILIALLFPLAVGPEKAILRSIAPGVLWIALLLAQLMTLDRLFQQELRDGCLDQWLLSPQPLVLLVSVKLLAYWLFSSLPILLLVPLLGLMYYLTAAEILVLWLSLLLGSPVLAAIGAIAAALVMGVRQRGLLLALILIPLYIPVLIFGTSAVMLTMNDISAVGMLTLLAAMWVLVVTFAPLTLASALRIGVEAS